MSRLGPRVRQDTRAGRLGTGMSREEGVKNETEHRLRVASSPTVLGHFKKLEVHLFLGWSQMFPL